MISKILTNIMVNGLKPDKQTARLLQQILEKHPYSQPVRMMVAKGLMDSDKLMFEEEVNKAVVCAPDRRKFRAYISGKNIGSITDVAATTTEQPQKSIYVENPAGNTPAVKKRASRQKAIIDRFLGQLHHMKRNIDNVPEGELAKESIEDHPDLISETLANVLAKQGKTDRAINIYEKLSLKFPEKSSTFAKKIESLKTENH